MAVSGAAQAVEISVTLTNLTGGMYFTPRLLVAHTSAVDMFEVGTAASTGLATIAEGGDTSVLGAALDATPDNNRHQSFGGLLAPATVSAVYSFETDDHPYLSMAAMLLPTNDAFVGLDSWVIPTEPGTYTINLNAYDAGTEANDEIVNGGGALGVPGIPVDPGGNAGTGGTGVTATEANNTVHIHRGNIGDDNPTGGASDVSNSVHRWLNPVARLTVTIN
ncbi:MAG: spondin domain-containing protein [Pseudomonadota bacterium]